MQVRLEYTAHYIVFNYRTLELIELCLWDVPNQVWQRSVKRDERPDWLLPFEKFIRENVHEIEDIIENSSRTWIHRSELS